MNIIRCISLFAILTTGMEITSGAYAQATPPSNPATSTFRITTHSLPNGLPQSGQDSGAFDRIHIVKPREVHTPYGALGVVQQCEELCFANGAHVFKYLGALKSNRVRSLDITGQNGGVYGKITLAF